MRFSAGAFALLLTACWLLPAQSSKQTAAVPKKAIPPPADTKLVSEPPAATEKLTYEVEWRLIHAGVVMVETQKTHAQMKLDSAGLVSSLFKVHDTYSATYDEPLCASSSLMDSFEGKRHHEARATYDGPQNRASFLERDVIKDSVIRQSEITIPNCVHEVIGAFLMLRGMKVEPGQSTQIPMSDGRRSASVKVEAQEREEVKAPAGSFKTIRYEANMLNGVVYTRKGRVFIWITDDAKHLPVQIRLRMPFPVGTVTLQLQKEEHS